MRACLLAFALLAAAPVQGHDHEPHVAEAEGLRVVHAWTPAVSAGNDLFVYMEIENGSDAAALLTGATAMGETLALFGFTYGAEGEAWRAIPGLPIPAGGSVTLEPQILALRLRGSPVDLVEGGGLDIEVSFNGAALPVLVEIGAPGATAHSHAGHDH
jgi:copper(I)-binding protein